MLEINGLVRVCAIAALTRDPMPVAGSGHSQLQLLRLVGSDKASALAALEPSKTPNRPCRYHELCYRMVDVIMLHGLISDPKRIRL
jgi:hypothetical protein